MNSLINARHLADYICSLSGFQLVERDSSFTYNHIGAVLTDAVLQSGLNYRSVVFPRVQRILVQYPTFNTTNSFWELLQEKGPMKVLSWNHHEKISRLYSLISLLKSFNIQSEDELRNWLLEKNTAKLLLDVKGIGPKTVDYLKNLLDISGIAVDRHIKTFVEESGLNLKAYYDIKIVVEFSADLMGVNRRTLDYSIWKYISVMNNKRHCGRQLSILPSITC